MKRVLTILAAVLFTATVWAQSPEAMSYQAVIRNSSNQLVTDQGIGMQISILQGSATGTAVYVETHTPTTNANGLVTVEIGNGTVVNGDFSTIDWANGPYFIKTEVDLNGGANYTITSTSQLLSMPYALHAKTADNIAETDPVFTSSQAANITATDITNLSNLSGVNTGDQDLTGATLNGTTLQIDIENGSSASVDLSSLSNDWHIDGNTGTTPGTDFIGTTDNVDLDIRTNNIIHTRITTKGQIEVLNTGRSVFIGEEAGENDELSNNRNVFIGYQAGYANTTGSYNTANGYSSLRYNTTGLRNTAIGYYSLLRNTSGEYNTANGVEALYSNTTGDFNTANGVYSLRGNTTGEKNTANGYSSLRYNTTGYSNTASGFSSLYRNTTGYKNVAYGDSTLFSNKAN